MRLLHELRDDRMLRQDLNVLLQQLRLPRTSHRCDQDTGRPSALHLFNWNTVHWNERQSGRRQWFRGEEWRDWRVRDPRRLADGWVLEQA